MLALYKKEILGQFSSPYPYLFAALFSFLMGWTFLNTLSYLQNAQQALATELVVRPLFSNMNILALFMVPLVTMKTFAAEMREQTFPLLQGSLLTSSQIILAKFFSCLTLMIFLLSTTLIFPIILFLSGYQQWEIILTSYLGVLLNFSVFISVGMLFSALTQNTMIAALGTFTFLLGAIVLIQTSLLVQNPLVSQILRHLSLPAHFDPFTRGVLQVEDIFYFISLAGMAFFITYKNLELRKW